MILNILKENKRNKEIHNVYMYVSVFVFGISINFMSGILVNFCFARLDVFLCLFRVLNV